MTNHNKLTWRHSVTEPELPFLLMFSFLFFFFLFFFFLGGEGGGGGKIGLSKFRDIGLVWKLFAPSHGLLGT